MPPGAAKTSDHVVILALDTLGDLVLRQPLFASLLDRGHPVTVVARQGYDDVLPYLDRRLRSLAIDINPHQPPDDDALERLRAISDRIAALRPDVIAAAAHNRTFADEWIARRFPECVTVGFLNPAKPSSLLGGVADENGAARPRTAVFDRMVECPVDEHEAVKQRALFSVITGSEMPERLPKITLTPDDMDRAAATLADLGLEPGRYVFGCPAGTVTIPLKAWPPAQFAEIAAAVHSRHGLPTLVAGLPSEKPILDAVAAAARERGVELPVWIGQPGESGRLLGLIAQSRVYVGNDSGPMHCAGALDVPVVARFGGGHWPRFVPLARRAFTATQNLPCFGCAWQCWLEEPACLTGVDAQTILAGIDWILSASADERRIDFGRPLDPHWVPLFKSAEKSVRRAAPRGIAAAAAPELPSDHEQAPRRLKVFVVTPSFNQALFLRETIESVLAQDYENLEYLVADGGSTDGSIEILKSYGDRVRWISGPDGGQAAAIARAWLESDADVVAWLNSDDTYLPGAISTSVSYLEAHPDAAMIYGEAWYVDAAGRRLRRYPTKPFDREALRAECFICQPAAFIRRDVFKIVDLPDPSLRYCMDYDLWIRISRHFHVDRLESFLATSRLHLENKSLGERAGLLLEGRKVSQKHFGTAHPAWKLAYADMLMRQMVGRLWRVPAWLRPLARQFEAWKLEDVAGPPFDDGWARRMTEVPFTADADGWATIDVSFPVWPYEGLLRIAAIHEKRICAVWRVRGPGVFALTFRLPRSARRRGSVVLSASQWFCPYESGRSADPRVLTFMIDGVKEGRMSTPEGERRAVRWNRLVQWLTLIPAAVQRVMLQACAPLVDRPLEVTLYDDGWAAPRTAVDVHAGDDGSVRLECERPDWRSERPLRITVSTAEGAVLAKQTVEKPGRFKLTFRLPGRAAERVLLEADQWFVPQRQGISEDPRLLSFRILDMIADGHGRVATPAVL